MKLKDLPKDDLPREKARKHGIKILSDSELLAILIGSGYKGTNALQLAQSLLFSISLSSLSSYSYESLIRKGLSEVKTLRLLASFEIAKRLSSPSLKVNQKEMTASLLIEYFSSLDLSKEEVVLLIYNKRGKLLCIKEMYKGTETCVNFSPIEIIKEIHKANGNSLILVHNHPSGVSKPSKADLLSTKKLDDLCLELDIQLIDHYIIGEQTYYSYREDEKMNFSNIVSFVRYIQKTY